MKKFLLGLVAGLALVGGVALAQQVNIYTEQGGSRMVVASGGELELQSGSTLDVQSGASVTWAGGVTQATETVTATNVVTAAESGTTFFLASATEFASTLPAPAAGLWYKFVIAAAPSGASYTVATNAGADVIILESHEVAGLAGIYDDNADVVTFVDGVAVVGDFLECVSDGTSWFCLGSHNADGGMTSGTT